VHRLLWIPLALALIAGAFRASPVLESSGDAAWTVTDRAAVLSCVARSDVQSERSDRLPPGACVASRFDIDAPGFTSPPHAARYFARCGRGAPTVERARAPPALS
jgi:hypothetical protein